MSTKRRWAPPPPCSVCGKGFRRRLGWARRMLVCLVDQNDRHHAACRNGCDLCVAAVRRGVRQ